MILGSRLNVGAQKGQTKCHTEAFPTCGTLTLEAPVGFGRKMWNSGLASRVLYRRTFCGDDVRGHRV